MGVACIPYMPMSIAWCQACLHAGVIPYWAAVANTAMCGGLPNTNEGWRSLVELSVPYHGKSMETFLVDVAKAIKEDFNHAE